MNFKIKKLLNLCSTHLAMVLIGVRKLKNLSMKQLIMPNNNRITLPHKRQLLLRRSKIMKSMTLTLLSNQAKEVTMMSSLQSSMSSMFKILKLLTKSPSRSLFTLMVSSRRWLPPLTQHLYFWSHKEPGTST